MEVRPPATLRGAHLTAWYTLAWFDKYVKGDGNPFSFYYPSRLDITVGGGRSVGCEHLRAGCEALVKGMASRLTSATCSPLASRR